MPIRTHIEYAGIIPHIEQLACTHRRQRPRDRRGPGASDLHTLALPLSYIWARNVLVLYSPRPDKAMFAEFLAWARARYDNVYFIGGGGTDLLSPGMRSRRSDGAVLGAGVRSDRYDAYPRRARTKPFDFTMYRFVDGASDEDAFRIDVGRADDLHVVRFHGKERLGRRPELSMDAGSILFCRCRTSRRQIVNWSLRMSNGRRPGKTVPARVTVFLAEREIGTANPDEQFRDYAFSIPSDLAAELAETSDRRARCASKARRGHRGTSWAAAMSGSLA